MLSCGTDMMHRNWIQPGTVQIAVCFLTFSSCALDSVASTFLVTNTLTSGSGSLRQAILDANSSPGLDTIGFRIAGSKPYAISPGTDANALPSITDSVILDGTTQTNFTGQPIIELIGANAGSANGLLILAGNTTVRGLVINRFARAGIRIEGAATNVIQGNYIGTGAYGTNALGNGHGGILIWESPGNLIGGVEATNRNIVSGNGSANGQAGISIIDPGSVGNLVQGNYIGVDVTGTNRLGNKDGVVLSMASSNLIGGTVAGARNIISGNHQSGVYFLGGGSPPGGSAGNWVQGNYIGVDVSGNKVSSNAADGITLTDSYGNVIGGTNSDARNVIAGNGSCGVNVTIIFDTNAAGNLICGNYIGIGTAGTNKLANGTNGVQLFKVSGNTVGGTNAGAGNVISGNGFHGVCIVGINGYGPRSNAVQGNYIGTDATGTNALGNSGHGVLLAAGATNNWVGGTTTEARNVISGNLQNGVYLVDTNTTANQVQGNCIGTDATGRRRLGNSLSGVRLEAPGNVIGGTQALAGNVISGNTNNNGLYIFGATASNNVVQGNFIGLDSTGTNSLGNGASGIGISGAPGTLIGGTAAGARNVISGNGSYGIDLQGAGATSNQIQGNYIGFDVSGNLPRGNVYDGIYISSIGAGNSIGGTASGAGNVISGNGYGGIYVISSPSTNSIQGNLIGTKPDGVSQMGVGVNHGIELRPGVSNLVIGGIESGAGNVIAFVQASGYDGIRIRDGSVWNPIRGNSIHSNGGSAASGLGIDLGTDGLTANDACDPDSGANQLQNFPVLTSAVSGPSSTVINGTLNSTANAVFLIQFFANTGSEPSGYGEGQTYLGETTVTNNGSCNSSFSVILPTVVPVDQFITATATDASNNTSEFSQRVAVSQTLGIAAHPTNQTVIVGQNATFTVTATGAAPLSYQWRFAGTNIAGATTNSYTRFNAQTNDAGEYRVVVTNDSGSVTSNPALLTVNIPPTITAQPTNLTVAQGQDATFTVTAAGMDPLHYQWRFAGTNIAGATATSYTRSNVQTNHAGIYDVVVTNAGGSLLSSNAVLTVQVPPLITAQPTNQTVACCQNATFIVSATSDLPLSYQWRFAGTNITGATGTSYTRFNVRTNHAGNYQVVITNSAGSVTSSNAALTVAPVASALTVSHATNYVRISWLECAQGLVLKETENLEPSYVWTAVTNVPVLIGNEYVVFLTPNLETNRFYRLTPP